jgi:RNA polymerase sigma factor (sigma-70 family)
VNESLLRELVPAVIGVLVRRGADFASAEDAVQEALIRALETWPDDPPHDPKAWLVAVAWRRFLDAARAEASRRGRELAVEVEPPAGPAPATDDTLRLYFLCAHPTLPQGSAAALTLRAVGGLTTRQIATAYLVPEATMAQRISRAKRRIAGLPLDQPGELGTVLRVLYLVFNEGYGGNVDLAAEAIRLTLPHPAARQPVSGRSLNYFALRDSFGSSGCMVSSCDLGGDDSGGRGGGDRCAWSGTGQPAALPDRAAVTATRPRSGGRASDWRRLAGAAVPGLWRPGAGSRPPRGGWSRPA